MIDPKIIKRDKKQAIEHHTQAEIKKGLKFVNSLLIRPNHILFEYDMGTGVLQRAKIDTETVLFDGSVSMTKKSKLKDNCQYFGALNEKNAIRKLKQAGLWKNQR